MEGLSLRPKGAAALLHLKGESPLRLYTRLNLMHRMEGCHNDRRGPVALLHREGYPHLPLSAQRNSMTDERLKLRPKGATAQLHRKGEPCPMLK